MGGRAKRLNIWHVSNSTGSTAQRVTTGALMQFDTAGYEVRTRVFTGVTTAEDVARIFRRRDPAGETIIVYTLVDPAIRADLVARAERRGFACVDVMEPFIGQLCGLFAPEPEARPGSSPLISHDRDDTFKVAEAIRFTLDHDDGLRPDGLERADVIILGVSRTGKTPVSIYLSSHGLRVANVPIVLPAEMAERHLADLAREMNRLPARKVGLEMDEGRLRRIRRARAAAHGIEASYHDQAVILEELEASQRLFRMIASCLVIDVTDRSVEETSAWILRSVAPG